MGYFDALSGANFKTGQDGSKLFFPWGILGRGYAIASDEDYRRLQQQIKIYMIVSLVLIMASGSAASSWSSFLVAIPLIGFYLVWMRYVLRRLKRSNEKLTLRETANFQAQAHNAVILWLLGLLSAAFVVVSIIMLIVDPRNWLLAISSIFFFGLCAAKIIWMLVLRRRATIARP